MIDDKAASGGGHGAPGDISADARRAGAPQDRDRQARAEAAAWRTKLGDQRVSNSDLAAFFAWREDSLNDAAYTRIEHLTTGVRALADDPRLQAIADAAARRPRGIIATLRGLTPERPSAGATGFGAALVAALAIGTVLFLQANGETYRTQIGERRAISLADGSTVELNTDSKVRVRLTKTRRSLILDRGQAMFAVAHDASRPFIVTAGDTSVRAIGTRFEVYRAQDAVRVTLAEGKVQVSQAGKRSAQGPAPAPVTLTAGERVEVGRARTAAPVQVDVAAATGWTNGRLTFKDMALSEAVAEVNRYSRRHVVLGDGVPTNERINGVFDAGDTEAFAAGMASALDLKTTPRADGGIELTGGRSGPA